LNNCNSPFLGKNAASKIMPKLLRFALLSFLISVSVPAAALVDFDFEQKYFIDIGQESKDHTLIVIDGEYHLYYLRGNPALTIGHATSPDLIHWTMQPELLSIGPSGSWDDRALWAPAVIPNPHMPGGLIMYFTGVNQYFSQSTGIAVSSDPYNFFKLPWQVYHPDPAAWAFWWPDQWANGRDPFVFEYGGNYYMLNTALKWNNRGAIALAQSSDLYNWEDIGPLFVNTTWHMMESPHLEQKDGKFHLFFTEETVLGTSTMKSDDLFTGWDINNSVQIDLGGAPEVTEVSPDYYVFSRHTVHTGAGGAIQYAIKFDELRWGGQNDDVPYINRPWPLADNWELVEGNAFYYTPCFWNNPEVRGETVDVGFGGNSWMSSYERYQGPLGVGGPGAIQGNVPTGTIRSNPFTIEGNSMSLLVGGSDLPTQCYVALIDANTQAVLYSETGLDTDEMDRREWDLAPHAGLLAYIEIADNSTTGHISCDDIVESWDAVADGGSEGGGGAGGGREGGRGFDLTEDRDTSPYPLALHQNTPNPFNPVTTIAYSLSSDSRVLLQIFDVQGRTVRTLTDTREQAGPHSIQWDGRNDAFVPLSTGVYFYRLTVNGNDVDTKKMILIK